MVKLSYGSFYDSNNMQKLKIKAKTGAVMLFF